MGIETLSKVEIWNHKNYALTINSNYRGLVYILLLNHSDQDFQVNIGDWIAQLILERIATPLVAEDPELDRAISTPLALSTLDLPPSSRDPCPETQTPTKNLPRVHSPDIWPSVPTLSHPRFTTLVPQPLGIPPLNSTSSSASCRWSFFTSSWGLWTFSCSFSLSWTLPSVLPS